ncbi:MAG: adenosylcobinamide-phosphate synthase CbiB [Hyphomicrobium sp.]
MTIDATFMVLALALGLDALMGYPQPLYMTIGHPVTWFGSAIRTADARLNKSGFDSGVRRALGLASMLTIAGLVGVVAYAIEAWLVDTFSGRLALAIVAATLFAARSLYDHVGDVARALDSEGLDAGRAAVAKIVGRDTAALDEHGVARAAIESLAENASDGVVAPAFWFAVAGLPGLAVYKAINTADSMIGHRTERHEAFGWAAARLDDLVNLPASRLTGLLLAVAAPAIPNGSASGAFAAMKRDALKHRSPNAGWPESAMAGAVGLKLNGPRVYDGAIVDDAFMGDGRREATTDDIRRALRLATIGWLILFGVVAALWLTTRD